MKANWSHGVVVAALLLLAAAPVQARTLAQIRESGALRICVAGSSADFYQANGEAFARFLKVKPEVKRLASFDQQFHNEQGVTVRDGEYVPKLLTDGSCDVFPNDLQVVDWRESKMRLVPYYSVRNVVLARQDTGTALKRVADLGGRRAALQKGTNYDDWLIHANADELAQRPVSIVYASTAESVKMVAEGKADFTIVGTEGALRWAREAPGLVTLFPVGEPVQVGWGILPVARLLEKELQRFFAESKRAGSELDENWRRHYHVSLKEYEQYAASFTEGTFDLRRILTWALPLLGGIAVVLAGILLWNRRLKREVTERQAAEQAVRETERWYRSVLESAPDGMIVVDQTGTIRLVNRGMQDVFGHAPEALVGRNVDMLLPEGMRQRHAGLIGMFFRAPAHRAMGAGAATLEGLRADGKLIPLEISLSPLPSVEGRTTMVAASIRDVSERKQADAALHAAHAEQDAIFESASSGIALVRNGRIERCNQRLEAIFGYAKGEVAGLTLLEFMKLSEAEREETTTRALAQLAAGETYRRERLLTRKDGSTFWCRFSGHAMDPGDLSRGTVWILEDASEEHAASDALRTANERLDLAQGAGNVGVFDVVIGGRNYWTPPLERMFGLQPGTFGGTVEDWAALLHPEDRERARRGFDAALANKDCTAFTDEFRVVRPDGSVRWFQSICHIFREPDGRAQRAVGVNIDATDLVSARRTAEEATRAKSMFLASMSHEIRTPMNGVLGLLQILGFSRLDSEQKATLDGARGSAQSLLRIIDDLLDFSKIEAGRLEIRPEATSIAGVIESVRQVYAGVASAKDLNLSAAIDPAISPALSVDPLRLRQILNNFTSNAIKFTAKGSVRIAAALVERKDGREVVRFSVTDTGIGVPKDAQARLFQPYVQATADTARQYGGTGLGLTICRRLADMMQGTIAMQSEPGKGTAMTLTLALPIADERELPKESASGAATAAMVAARRSAPTVEQARADGTLVLLVEDHPTNRSVLTRLLALLGYAAQPVENGRLALEAWRDGRFGAILTDCNMPEMDGYELARAIRSRESGGGSRVPIIACTAAAQAGEAERCIAAGMDDFIPKPVELQALAKAMERWLPLPKGDAAASDVPLDRSSLAAIAGGDAAVEREILADFKLANDADISALRGALAGQDVAEVTRVSHRVKGACKMVGALALAGVCERMEKAGRQNSWNGVAAERDALEREIERLNSWLEAN